MSTTIATPTATTGTTPHPPIPMTRLVSVELRKMFDTRSGAWLLGSVGILAVLATAAVILFVSDTDLDYEMYASAIGVPMTIILPIIAILSITGEWTQRTGLTTFTFVPDRGRVISAKALATVLVGVGSMLAAAGIGAIGNVVGTAITGTDLIWNISVLELGLIILANVLGMAIGFMLGVLMRNSAAAIVGYFVYAFVLPTLLQILALTQDWFEDIRSWVDFNFAQTSLYDGVPGAEQWAQMGVSGTFWLLIPLAIGLRLVLRSEVK